MTALFDKSGDTPEPMEAAAKALSFPLGVASPLWLMFAGATTAGVAFWWATRWRYATNLEAVLAPPEPQAEPTPIEVAPEAPPTVAEAAEPVVEATPEPVLEAAPEPSVDLTPEPAVEAAPEPILDVAPTPKPKAPPRAKAASVRRAPRTTSGPTRRS
ncbi:MAG TPA: hypothetical protein VFW47_14170 [Phenylobacterium sp.]|nr:hypothetical protein [Phenylobacterium sp.]